MYLPADKTTKQIALDILKAMPIERKTVLRKALERNCDLTSSYILEDAYMEIYIEGFYLKLEGTRSSFSVYAEDNDGEYIIKRRKPNANKLNLLWNTDFKMSESDFNEF